MRYCDGRIDGWTELGCDFVRWKGVWGKFSVIEWWNDKNNTNHYHNNNHSLNHHNHNQIMMSYIISLCSWNKVHLAQQSKARPLNQGRKIINPSGGYPPDIQRISSGLWPMSVEIRWISGGYPVEGFMIFRPWSMNRSCRFFVYFISPR